MVTVTPNQNYEHVVLLVEDNPEALQLIAMILVEGGCKVITADNGYEALQVAHEARFDLLITDLNMPHMSGNELLEKLQLDIPSLCVTAIPEKASCNFSRVLAKPFRITELLSIVRELLPPKSSKGEDHNEQKSVP